MTPASAADLAGMARRARMARPAVMARPARAAADLAGAGPRLLAAARNPVGVPTNVWGAGGCAAQRVGIAMMGLKRRGFGAEHVDLVDRAGRDRARIGG